MFQIEKGVPLTLPGNTKYPFKAMMIDESVFIPKKTTQQLSACLWQLKPMKFASRKEKGGTRVWRIA